MNSIYSYSTSSLDITKNVFLFSSHIIYFYHTFIYNYLAIFNNNKVAALDY